MITFKEFLLEGRADDLEAAEDFVRGWTFDSNTFRTGADSKNALEGFNSAFKVWPFKGKKLYRGLVFKNKKDYEAFLKMVEGGILNEPRLSSWTPYKEQARTYALLGDDYGDEYKFHVVLSMVPVGPLVDARKASRGENEIIVPPGKHQVKVEETQDDTRKP